MKSIIKYLNESIFGNLGINDDIANNLSIDWVEKYNNQFLSGGSSVVATLIVKNGVICDKNGNQPTFLYIKDESILENGHIPTWLKFKDDGRKAININIMTDKFTSFEGLPECEYMSIDIYSQIDCFDTITNCNAVCFDIHTGSPVIADVKPEIRRLECIADSGVNKNLPPIDPVKILSNVTRCKFKGFNNGYNGKISNNTTRVEFKNTEVLSNFFQKNKFEGNFEITVGTVPDLEFLDDVPPSIKITKLYLTPKDWRKWMREFNENKQIQYISQLPQVDKFFDPVKRNKNKFNGGRELPMIGLDIKHDSLGKDAVYQLSSGFLETIYIN